jgi:TP901 family phage tail tape measure protein
MARDLLLRVGLTALDRASRPLRAIANSSVGLGRSLKDTRAELKGLQGQQRDVSSFRTLKGEADKTGSALQASRDKVRQLSQELANTANPTKQLSTEFKRAVREATNLKQKHSEQQRELQGLRGKLSAAGISTRNLGQHERELRSKISATNQALTQQENRLKRVTAQQKALANAKQQYERTQSLAGSMAGTGAAGLATGSGILYAGAQMMAPGLDFDASMSKVQALTRLQKDDPQLQALRDQARQLGSSTQFTAGQAADAQGFLGMAGFDPKAIQAAMPGMLDLAKAGDMDLAQTADIASNILGGFGLQATEMGKVGDVLTKAFTTSNTNLQMLGETMKYVGPVARASGMGLEEAAAMAGLLGNVGIQSSQAGTTLRAMLLRLAAPAGPAAKAMAKLGVESKDAAGNVRGITSVLADVAKATENMGTGDRLGYLKAIFGEEPAAGMAELLAQAGSDGLTKYLDVVKDYEGEASRTSRVMADNLRGDLSALGSAWEDLGIQMQDQQNGPMREVAQSLTGIIGGVKGWIAENPKLAANIVKTAAGVGILMAGMGGLTLALASILGPFAMVRYGLMLFGIRGAGLAGTLFNLGRKALPLVVTGLRALGVAAMANPIGAIVAGIALVASLIYANWDRVGPYFLGLWAEIKQGFSGGLGGIAATLLNFSPLGLFYRAFAGVMGYLGVELPGKFTEFGGMIMQGLVNGIKNAAGAVKGAVVGAADSSINYFKEKLGIHSPSRVFAQLGDFTMQGLAQGLSGGEGGPMQALTGIGKRLTQAGAIALSATVGSGAIAMDNRPPLSAASTSQAVASAAPNITINVHPSAGMDEQALARLVAAEVAKIQQRSQVRARSSLSDQD